MCVSLHAEANAVQSLNGQVSDLRMNELTPQQSHESVSSQRIFRPFST